jgi:hypothetical protein
MVSLVAGGVTYGVSLGITKVFAGRSWTGWLVGAVDEVGRDGKRVPGAEARKGLVGMHSGEQAG